MKAWCYFWAYLDIFGEWLEDQVDNNDYLAGALFLLFLFEMVWFAGIINVTFAGVK